MRQRLNEKPKSILIVKLGAVGDCIHTLVAARVLRRRFPECTLGWLVEGKSKDVVLGHPDLDHVHVWNRKQSSADFFSGHPLRAKSEIDRVIHEIRGVGYEVAIDFQNLLKSGYFTRRSGAELRIGFDRLREGNFLFTNRRVTADAFSGHMVRRYLALLAPLGVEVKDDPPAVPIAVSDDDRQVVDSWWHDTLSAEERVVAINPAASLTRKLWPLSRYAEVADRLREQFGCRPLLIWGPNEQELVDEVAAQMKQEVLLAPPTTIKQLAYLFSRCTLYVGNDSGPMHLAAAMGIGVVGLFGPSDPRRVGPWTSKGRAVEPDEPFRKGRSMEGIDVERVVVAAAELLEK